MQTLSKQDFRPFVNDILAVVVLYKIDIIQSKSFISMIEILKDTELTMDLLVYDNSPLASSRLVAGSWQLVDGNIKIHYIHDKDNSGVSRAYNKGFELSKVLKKKWILFADQDTTFPLDLIDNYFISVNENPDIHLFVPRLMQGNRVLSPCKFQFNRGSSFSNFAPGVYLFKKLLVINSGMLISVESFSKAGGFNERIKLDFADFYFINKFKKIYNSFVVTNSTCIHELSSSEINVDNILHRFKYYCQGARIYSQNITGFLNLFILALYRTIKLTFIYKRFSFIREFVLYFLIGKEIS